MIPKGLDVHPWTLGLPEAKRKLTYPRCVSSQCSQAPRKPTIRVSPGLSGVRVRMSRGLCAFRDAKESDKTRSVRRTVNFRRRCGDSRFLPRAGFLKRRNRLRFHDRRFLEEVQKCLGGAMETLLFTMDNSDGSI